MARNPKIEVSAVNLRIPAERTRDYGLLIRTLASLKRGARVFGDTYVAISHYDPALGVGILSKYNEIDIDGDWFDLEDFDAAPIEKVEKISIPENLRPNLSQFYFTIDEELHLLVYSSYMSSNSLSTRSVGSYFNQALLWPEIADIFGRVEADIVKSYGEIERILALPDLRELRFIVRRPNTDDISASLASVIEKRLQEQNSDEYEEAIKGKSQGGIKPNERTKQLAVVAAENGLFKAKSVVNGVTTEHSTEETPLVEKDTFSAEASEIVSFLGLAKKIIKVIQDMRTSLGDQS